MWVTGQIKFAIDPASSVFLSDGVYDQGFKDENYGGNKLDARELESLC